MCAHKAFGDPTVQSAVPVRTEAPALPRMAHVFVHLDTEEPHAKEVSLRFFLKATSLNPNLKEELSATELSGNKLHHSTDLVLIFEELLKCLPTEKWHSAVGHNGLSVNPSSQLSLNHSIFTPAASPRHTHMHITTHTSHPPTLSLTTSSQWETQSPRLRLISGHVHWERQLWFLKGVCLKLLSSEELTD